MQETSQEVLDLHRKIVVLQHIISILAKELYENDDDGDTSHNDGDVLPGPLM